MSINYKNLVFEGGGVKGIAYGGALQVLEEMKVLANIKRVAGASAGAINAALLAVGYNYKEVSDIIAKTNFGDFKDGGFLGGLKRVFYSFGYYKGDDFSAWLDELIKKKTGKGNLTFKELKTSGSSYRELYIISSNLSCQKADIFSHELTPDFAIRDAVRMSMSIPLFFQSVKHNGHVFVDGGVTWNYPVNIFDHTKYLDNPANGKPIAYDTSPGAVFNHETLGFRLDSLETINYTKNNADPPVVEIKGIKEYALALVDFMMETANKIHLHQNDWNRTVFIDTLDVRTTQFEIAPEKVKALIDSGIKGTKAYFDWKKGVTEDPWSVLPS